MKKYFYCLLAVMLTALSTTALTSCGSDDDDDNNNNNNGGGSSVTGNNSSLVKDGNILLTSITDSRKQETYTFEYDELLRPISAKETDSYNEDVMFSIDYNTGKILYNDMGYMSVSFNNNGYVNKIQVSWNGNDNEDGLRGYQSTTVSYDNNGHVIGTETVFELYEEDGQEDYEKEVSKSVLTWENGNLTKYENNSTWSGRDGKVLENNKYTQTFTYSNIPNKYKQFCLVYGDEEGGMFMTGLYGVGPNMLPQTEHSLEIAEYEGRKDNYESNWRLEFTQNENGTINTEKQIDSQDGHIRIDAQYHYTPANEYKASGTRAAMPQYKKDNTSKRQHIKKLMRRMMRMQAGAQY